MNKSAVQIPEPKLARFLWSDSRMGWVWLVLRLYVGYQWLEAGWGKIMSPTWVGAQAGTSLRQFFVSAAQQTTGAHPNVSSWYGFFVTNVAAHHPLILSYLVAYGEFAVGVALILGAFTGIAAFFGAFMNLNYLFAGALSINPLLLVIQFFLILAWRNAGWFGLDRWLLPWLGVPWQPNKNLLKELRIEV